MRPTWTNLYVKHRKLLLLIIIITVCYFCLRFIWQEIDLITCAPTTIESVVDARGLDFLVTQRDCDCIAHFSETLVQVSRTGRQEKTLVFLYAPTLLPPLYVGTAPKIGVSRDGDINISIDSVSEILMHDAEWDGRRINYEIGHIRYPSPLPSGFDPPMNKP